MNYSRVLKQHLSFHRLKNITLLLIENIKNENMKYLVFQFKITLLFTMLTTNLITAQVAVNTDNSTADPSAMLEVKSNEKGVLIPRMTVGERNNISNPATGLMIYVIDDNRFHFYDGNGWMVIAVPDGDGNSNNELQSLSKSGTNITLSNGGGTVSIIDGDGSSTNELDSKWVRNGFGIYNLEDNRIGIGTNVPDSRLHIKSPNTTGEETGIKLTQGSSNSLFYHNENNDLILRKLSATNQLVLDTDGNVGIGTDAPGQALDVNGEVRIRGGSPESGKILTAQDNNGNALWADPVSLNNATSVLEIETTSTGNGTDWSGLGADALLNNLNNGDKILVICSFKLKLEGGSGTDKANFRIVATKQGGGQTQYSIETGQLDDLNRNNYMLYSLHRVFTINKGTGNYKFQMEIEENLFDDTIRFDQQEITAIKL
jgi:hypothetical protein